MRSGRHSLPRRRFECARGLSAAGVPRSIKFECAHRGEGLKAEENDSRPEGKAESTRDRARQKFGFLKAVEKRKKKKKGTKPGCSR